MKSLNDILTWVYTTTRKHRPEILTGIGITGMISAIVVTAKMTPKALDCIEVKKDELDKDDLTVVETAKAVWKCYIPTVTLAGVSAACIICASSENLKRNTALAAAYSLSERSFMEYRNKVAETISERKEKEIRDSVNHDRVIANPAKEVIATSKGGKVKCFDAVTGRYFQSDKDTINKAMNEINRKMRDELYITHNDFYSELGLEPSKMGDMFGWNIDKGYLDIFYTSCLDENGTPCLVIEYHVDPI